MTDQQDTPAPEPQWSTLYGCWICPECKSKTADGDTYVTNLKHWPQCSAYTADPTPDAVEAAYYWRNDLPNNPVRAERIESFINGLEAAAAVRIIVEQGLRATIAQQAAEIERLKEYARFHGEAYREALARAERAERVAQQLAKSCTMLVDIEAPEYMWTEADWLKAATLKAAHDATEVE